MTYEQIIYTVKNGVATITLNRPEKRNSFTRQMSEETLDALTRVREDRSVRALVITGEGPAFCAGQDLDEAIRPGVRIEDLVERQYNAMVRAIRHLPKPVLAQVNGAAAGAGANLAYACDLIFAAKSAFFVQSFIHVGLIPDSGGTYTLPRLVGRQRAFGQMVFGEKVTAERAEQLGMIWKVVDDSELQQEVTAAATKLASMPTLAIGLTKHALNRAQGSSLDKQLQLESELQAEAGRSADSAEGIRAFFEGGKPAFAGH